MNKSKLLASLLVVFAAHFLALIVLLAVSAPVAHAQATTPDLSAAAPAAGSDAIASFIGAFAGSHPWLVTLASIVGALRLVFKPIVTGVEAYVRSTPSTADDQFIDKVEHSSAFKAVAWCLDYFGSIKLGPQFTAKPKGENPTA